MSGVVAIRFAASRPETARGPWRAYYEGTMRVMTRPGAKFACHAPVNAAHVDRCRADPGCWLAASAVRLECGIGPTSGSGRPSYGVTVRCTVHTVQYQSNDYRREYWKV